MWVGLCGICMFAQKPNTRPLETKLKNLMQYFLEKLCETYGVDNANEQREELLLECLGKLSVESD